MAKAPLLGCFLLLFPVALAAVFCYLCCKARPNMADDHDGGDSIALLAPSLLPQKKLSSKKAD